MSRETGIPVSTIFDRIKTNEVIKKHTAIIDFAKLGYTKVNMMLKVKKDQREDLKRYLEKHNCVNSAYKVNNNYDYLVEGVFSNIREIEDFIERMETKFDIETKDIYYIVDEINAIGIVAQAIERAHASVGETEK